VELTRYPYVLSEIFGQDFLFYLQKNLEKTDVQAVQSWIAAHSDFHVHGKSLFIRAIHSKKNLLESAIGSKAKTVPGGFLMAPKFSAVVPDVLGSLFFNNGTTAQFQVPALPRYDLLISSIASLLRDHLRLMTTKEGDLGMGTS